MEDVVFFFAWIISCIIGAIFWSIDGVKNFMIKHLKEPFLSMIQVGKDNESARMFKQDKLKARLESLKFGVMAQMYAVYCTEPPEPPSTEQLYRKCMYHYHRALSRTLRGIETVNNFVERNCSLNEINSLALVVQKLRDNTSSLMDNYETLTSGLDRDTDEQERRQRVNIWCKFIADWPKIPELNELKLRLAAEALRGSV
ncbi:uncharacterized protein EV420DRAFT_1073275 [Desarmillaria tabescens]|uniref:Uncharacterized protein n=1 Tax=Armillaria tabescens TaxID=1929756 RepID=A0AA39JH55_ARMTA|nr:uncharacterized protein EV420DRAFT_1073275 [Desarmillaria tabescens]KAK0442687.1 hypothetical protein EV420DRAFT_1073275 [Desarmillaria tabescens]